MNLDVTDVRKICRRVTLHILHITKSMLIITEMKETKPYNQIMISEIIFDACLMVDYVRVYCVMYIRYTIYCCFDLMKRQKKSINCCQNLSI